MDNKGWSLAEMLVMVVVLIIAGFISFCVYKKTFGAGGVGEQILDSNESTKVTTSNNDTEVICYTSIESNMIKATKKYMKENSITSSDDTLIVSLFKLENDNYIDTVVENNTKCSGYIEVINDSYRAYLKCPNYETKGYDISFDK